MQLRHREQRYLALVPKSPTPPTGSSIQRMSWQTVNSFRIYLISTLFCYMRPYFASRQPKQQNVLIAHVFSSNDVADCNFIRRNENKTTDSFTSFNELVRKCDKNSHSKRYTFCKLLKQRVSTYSPWSKCCKLFDDIFGFREMSSVDLFWKKPYAFSLDY